MPRKLKVFRTPIGFHDAYVAAPTKKAALEAWGTDANLFARGTAEEVTDATLTAAPLERPGEVIRVSRGDLAAQLKALGPRKKLPARGKAEAKRTPAKHPAKRKPPPKRNKVDTAEAALEQARERHDSEVAALEKERDAIERQIEALRATHDKETTRLQRARDKARAAYSEALANWDD
ncbi:MAG: hypothetical protein ACO1OD_01935 [Croceibacterium sp.]